MKKLAAKLTQMSFKDGKIQEQKVLEFVGKIKSLPVNKAIYILLEYLKGLKRESSKYTLTVESAVKLSPAELKKIQGAFKNSFASVSQVINPGVIGGVRVRIGDTVVDSSVKNKLEQLRGAISG